LSRPRAGGFVAAMLVASVLAGCGAGTASSLGGDLTLEQAQAIRELPLVYAGESVDGLSLMAILRRDDTASYVSFVYGDCDVASPDGGCAPPAEIQVWPRSRRSAGSYDASVPGAPLPENATIRGWPAAFFDGGTRLEIYTARVTVVVFSGSRARLHTIAGALRCLRETARATPGDRLDC
jgi:hypothetical protein